VYLSAEMSEKAWAIDMAPNLQLRYIDILLRVDDQESQKPAFLYRYQHMYISRELIVQGDNLLLTLATAADVAGPLRHYTRLIPSPFRYTIRSVVYTSKTTNGAIKQKSNNYSSRRNSFTTSRISERCSFLISCSSSSPSSGSLLPTDLLTCVWKGSEPAVHMGRGVRSCERVGSS
jgi:hypothetical protein